jgi:hypothetical protein
MCFAIKSICCGIGYLCYEFMVFRTFYGMVLFPSIKWSTGFDGKCLPQRFVLLKNLKTSENGWGKGEK